jgi:hypothetical protein
VRALLDISWNTRLSKFKKNNFKLTDSMEQNPSWETTLMVIQLVRIKCKEMLQFVKNGKIVFSFVVYLRMV